MSSFSRSAGRLSLAVAAVAAIAGVLVWTTLWSDRDRADAPRSIILITIDTLRADHLSSAGYARNTSPNLDAFFARGTRFANAFSTAPNTAPSHTAMLTGLYPGFTSVWKLNGDLPLTADAVTLAEIARDAGMRTAAVISNVVLSRSLGLDQGFESYDDDLRDVELNRPWAEQTADHAVPKVLAKLDELRGERFFLWAQFQDPHGPYAPPAEWARAFADEPASDAVELPVGKNQSGYRAIPQYQVFRDERGVRQYRQRYDGEIAYLDSKLQALFDKLVTGDMLRDTLVIVTSDHGEAFGEDEFYFAHGHSTSLDQLHVPLAFVGAGVPAGASRRRPVSNISIFCTAIEALRLPANPECSPGASLWPALKAGEEPSARAWFAGSVTQWAVVQPGLFLRRDAIPENSPLFSATGDSVTGAQFVPVGEQVLPLDGNGTPPDTNVTRMLLDRFAGDADAARARLGSQGQRPAAISAEHAEKLRLLGYLSATANR